MAVQTENIKFPGAKYQLDGYLAKPEGTGPFPAVVVIHEIFGLNDNIREIAERFAGEGYIALAVDLFSNRNRVLCIMSTFNDLLFKSPDKSSGVADLKAALDYLTGVPGVDGKRLGAIGFCMGGSYAIAWGCSDPRLKVVAPYYGMNPKPLETVRRSCPVVGSYPDKDFTTKAGQKLDETLKQFQIKHDIKTYPNSKHSFFNDKGKTYNEEAAKDSWNRVLSFFEEQLAPKV